MRSPDSIRSQQQLDFSEHEAWPHLPSPKRIASETIARKHLPWEGNYAAFSTTFALAAVRYLAGGKSARILDPFAGSGTTLEAAADIGVPATGIELNPYSALLSRCRVAFAVDSEAVESLLSEAFSGEGVDSDAAYPEALTRSKQLLTTISSRLECSTSQLIRRLCRVDDGSVDSYIVALVSLLHLQRVYAHTHKRSNPAWLVLSDGTEREEPNFRVSLRNEAQRVARLITEDLASRRRRATRISVQACDFMSATIRAGSVSRFLTSPPYLNRLDYVNPTVPVLESIGVDGKPGIENLRAEMMGTTKMRSTTTGLGKRRSATVQRFLTQVAAHKSKASSTYYYKFFHQYFDDLAEFFRWLSICTSPSATGLIVIQDSFYKEIRVPILEVFQDMAGHEGFGVDVIHQESRQRHMGSISPHQRTYAPRKALTEYVLQLSRVSASSKS